MTAASRGWGPGWPNCQWDRFTTIVRADGLRLPMRREVASLTSLLIDLTELAGYDVKVGETWGVACRPISGTDIASNHSWGLAVDVNAPSNPYASAEWHRRNARGTRPFGLAIVCDIPQQIVELWEAHGFGWGGRYRTKPDPMHFEQLGTPAQVAEHERRLRTFLAAHGNPPPPPPEETMDWDKLREIIRDEVNGALAARGVIGDSDDVPGGAIAELRRNVRRTAKAAGVPESEIE